MDYFPVFLNLHGRQCLIVGGGDLALRKARLLLSAGAVIRVVAPETNSAFAGFLEMNALRVTRRRFQDSDVVGNWLVVSATGDVSVEKAVYEASTRAGVFCNGVDDKSNCSYITPAIVDRSPVVIAVSSGGAAPVLVRKTRAKIEMLLPRDLGRLASLASQWRSRVTERIDNLPGRRCFWEAVFDGPVADLSIGGHIGKAEQEMATLVADFERSSLQRGEAWLVGAGPGDPDLLTVRALQIMQAADVIVHDRLVSDEVLALARRDADLISVGKAPGCRANSQPEINELLVSLVRSGKRVCRLKGGDPFIFGRGGEELEALAAADLPCEVVPGISAAAACAASAGIPLTHRDLSQSVVFVAAHGKGSVDRLDWQSLARDRQTLAFYMAVNRFPELMNKLIGHGRPADTPIAIIERGTMPGQRVVRGRLGQLVLLAEAQRITAPAILIVGEVAAIGDSVIMKDSGPVDAYGTQSPAICAEPSA
ncbi:MAG: uroporphyrinogen-III C-methyltransferase [Gammaproteobacteria bacterium]|nr:uroporphyrinogen-III C-methyltransferase [Gammaproteobacteria bacterium]